MGQPLWRAMVIPGKTGEPIDLGSNDSIFNINLKFFILQHVHNRKNLETTHLYFGGEKRVNTL